MPENDSGVSTVSESDGWKLATIKTQDYGPRYYIDGPEAVWHTVDTVRFNGFTLGLDGRAEVEYRTLTVHEEEYPTGLVAEFSDDLGE